MKKNLLYLLSILTFSVLLVSCSNDDEEDNPTTSFKADFYLDGEKQDVSELISDISYDEYTKRLNVLLMSENDNKRLGLFSASFEGADFYTLKAGDNLILKSEYVNYTLKRNNDAIMYTMVKDPYDQTFKNYIGKATIKNIDQSKKYIEIEFQDCIVVGGTSKAEHKIKGTVCFSVTIRTHNPN